MTKDHTSTDAQAAPDCDPLYAIAKIIAPHAMDTVRYHGRENASAQAVRDLDDAVEKAKAILALQTPGAARNCDCGFSAEVCATNPCMRKKVHRAGLTPGSKWPDTGSPSVSRSSAGNWEDDPASDERWTAGCNFAMEQLCSFLDVDPASVTWDAATETVDGDVQAVLGNILRAKFGENWGPRDTVSDGAIYAAVSQRNMTADERDLIETALAKSATLINDIPDEPPIELEIQPRGGMTFDWQEQSLIYQKRLRALMRLINKKGYAVASDGAGMPYRLETSASRSPQEPSHLPDLPQGGQDKQ